MLSLFDPLRDLSLLSVSARMLLAVLCGGVIGIEREYKKEGRLDFMSKYHTLMY